MLASNSITIFVDADSCPNQTRTMIVKFAIRLNIKTFFVANRQIPIFINQEIPKNLIKMVVTDNTPDAADDFIVKNSSQNDVAITRDIPLAERLLKNDITVINDRGTIFSSDNIREKLSIRNFNYELVKNGIQIEKQTNYNKKDLNNFANCLDKILQKKIQANLEKNSV